MSTHLKLNFLVQSFNRSNNSETQSHDDSKEGVLSAQTSQCLLLPLVYGRETTNFAAGIDERERLETGERCDFYL